MARENKVSPYTESHKEQKEKEEKRGRRPSKKPQEN